MKKMIATLLAAMMLLSLLSGCGIGRKAPDATTEAPIETAAAAETTEAATEAATVPVNSNSSFKAGTWMSEYESTGWYYFFDEGGASGYFVSMDDGAGESFTYVQNGDEAMMFGLANHVRFRINNTICAAIRQVLNSGTILANSLSQVHVNHHNLASIMGLLDFIFHGQQIRGKVKQNLHRGFQCVIPLVIADGGNDGIVFQTFDQFL